MTNNVHIIAVAPTDNDITEWDVRIVKSDEFIGVIEKIRGPEDINELATYTFTDTFGHMEAFDSIFEARDYAERSINPITVN